MNLSPDEGRTARIQKYKEERRKQLTARTATLFSSNVTQRRPKKNLGIVPSDDSGNLNSRSEINIDTASTSVPIRTTRTSRLRAAATNYLDSSLCPKKSLISSSVQSLVDDRNLKAINNTSKPDKNKSSTIRRQTSRKENFKVTSEKSVSDKEIGATKLKPKHSTEKAIIEKSNKYVNIRSKDNKVNKNLDSGLTKKHFENVKGDVAEDIVNKIRNCEKTISNNIEKEFFYNDLVDTNAHNDVKDNYRDGILENLKELKSDPNENNIPVINVIETDKGLDNVVKDCVVPNDRKEETGDLAVACMPQVKRFSELLSNLCSPCDAEQLFEDILAENGIDDGLAKSSSPECTAPCRRAQPSAAPRAGAAGSTAAARAQAPLPARADVAGSTTKPRSRRSIEASPLKTESSLPSSKICPRTNVNTSPLNKSPSQKSSPISKINERRRSTEICTKPSFIPLSKKAADKQIPKNPTNSLKQHTSRESTSKFDTKSKVISSRIKVQKVQHKSISDSENIANEKYHNSKKRLISLEKNPQKDSYVAHKSKINLSKKGLSSNVEIACTNNDNFQKMTTLHESVRPHTSRLSQEMESLAALTKQTLDRVNKLSTNLNSTNKINLDVSDPRLDTFLVTENNGNTNTVNYGLTNGNVIQPRGVTERLRDIDTAAQRLLDFEKQSAMFSDLSNDTSSHNRRQDNTSTSYSHTPVSILKRKSIHEDSAVSNTPNQAIASPPVTFSPSVLESRNCRSENRQRQGILKKRRSLDDSQVVQRRSCSPEVSFADDSSSDVSKPILKNRRSSLEDVIRNRSPDGQIQGILKRKISKEEEHFNDDLSHGSPEPHSILKRKSNSSSSSSTTSSHVSIAQAVLLAAAGGAELVEEDKEIVRPILKKKSFSEERPCLDVLASETPRPILKKKSVEHDDYDFDLPKKPILKTPKRLSSDEGHTSSFDLSGEDDRSSRRSSLLRSRTSDHSGSECEATVRPILKQRGSSLTRERSQSPRPRLSFCADNDADISVTSFSSDANDLSAAGLRRVLNLSHDPEDSAKCHQHPSAVLRRRNLRPRDNLRSKSLACDLNDELLSILTNRRLKVEDNCETVNPVLWEASPQEEPQDEPETNEFPSIAARIKSMEEAFTTESSTRQKPSSSRVKNRDRDRYKTQPVTVEEMRSVASSLEPGQAGFEAFGNAGCSFPRRLVESGAADTNGDPADGEPDTDLFAEFVKKLDSPPFGVSFYGAKSPTTPNSLSDVACAKDDSIGEATFLDFENIAANCDRRQSTLDEIEKEVNKVRVALDEDSRALEEDDRQQAEADNWSLNVSCDSGVYNRASSRDSGPHSGEELGLIESQDIKENHAANSCNEWSSPLIERGLLTMDRERKSTENEGILDPKDQESDEDDKMDHSGFALGLVKSNSVVARASMWQQLQQKAKGTPKPLVRHSRQKAKDAQSVADHFKSQDIQIPTTETTDRPQNQNFSLAQSKSAANMLDRDEDAKLDEDDPAKMSMTEKMRMFNSKLTHKPPVAGLPRPKEAGRSRQTMPVLASQVQEALDQNERLTQSLTNDVPRNPGFKLKMELFRSASAKNTSLEYLMRQNAKFRSLDLDEECPTERAQRMITPEVRGILKSGTTVVPSKHHTLAKGESSEGLKDEGIDSSSDEESASASSVSSSEKSCSSSDSSDEMPGPKPRRFHRKNKLNSSRTDSDLTRVIPEQIRKIQLPGAMELKEKLNQAKNLDVKIPVLGKLAKKVEEKKETEDRYKRLTKVPDEPIQLGKLRRPVEKVASQSLENPTTVLKISALNQEAKNKFFGLDTTSKKEKDIDAITAAVRKYIPSSVTKSVSTHALEAGGGAGASGSDGESSGGREVRRINTRGRHRVGSGVQRSATHSEMPHRGGTIAERLAALQAAGANDWRARVCRLSPDREDSKAIERAKNMINVS